MSFRLKALGGLVLPRFQARVRTMSTMKVVQITKTGGVEVLEYADVPIPKPEKDQVLVKNAFSGVNFIDTYTSIKQLQLMLDTSVLAFTQLLKIL